jgi:Family of unknown function (DUF6364)
MDTKLTLKLDASVIEKAKIYALEHKFSLSSMVENYFKTITSKEKNEEYKEFEITTFVKNLSIGNGEIPADHDYKKERQEYLIQKHK